MQSRKKEWLRCKLNVNGLCLMYTPNARKSEILGSESLNPKKRLRFYCLISLIVSKKQECLDKSLIAGDGLIRA